MVPNTARAVAADIFHDAGIPRPRRGAPWGTDTLNNAVECIEGFRWVVGQFIVAATMDLPTIPTAEEVAAVMAAATTDVPPPPATDADADEFLAGEMTDATWAKWLRAYPVLEGESVVRDVFQ